MIARIPVLYILLAAYRGERFLSDLLDSLLGQSDPHWRLLVSDDGSDDDTLSILHRYAAVDARIIIVERPSVRLGATANFGFLLHNFLALGGEWFALCDQDDIWRPYKIERLRSTMQDYIAAPEPYLAFSDLNWIDEHGRQLAPSHFAATAVGQPGKAATVFALLHNLVPGCAMVGNRALARQALPFPECIAHHDWWLLTLAAAGGKVLIVNEALICYRQHGGNLIGASTARRRIVDLLTHPTRLVRHARVQYWGAIAQGKALHKRLGSEQLASSWREALAVLETGLAAPSRWRRMRTIMSGALARYGFARRVFMLIGALQTPQPCQGREICCHGLEAGDR